MGSIVFFDGICNLCNGSVDFIISKDTKGNFKFVSLQSKIGHKLLEKEKLDTSDLGTIILLQQSQLYYRSDAILEIIRQLKVPWPLLYVFKIVPRFARDGLYNLVSKNRYQWFGKRNTCRIPSSKERAQFLEDEDKVPLV